MRTLLSVPLASYDHCVLTVHDPVTAPSPDDWTAHCELLAETLARYPQRTCNLVITDGPGPDAAQRKQVKAIENDSKSPVAVISCSVAVRGAVTALSWLGINIKAFDPGEAPSALEFLQLPPAARAAVRARVEAFERQNGVEIHSGRCFKT